MLDGTVDVQKVSLIWSLSPERGYATAILISFVARIADVEFQLPAPLVAGALA